MAFDVDAIMATTVAGANSTKIKPLPEGIRVGRIDQYAPKTGTSKKNDKDWMAVNLAIVFDDPECKEATGLEEPRGYFSFFLDINQQGHLDMSEGKNIGLGRARHAAGINDDGPFSFDNFVGRLVKARIVHRADESDPDDGVRSEIAAIYPMDYEG